MKTYRLNEGKTPSIKKVESAKKETQKVDNYVVINEKLDLIMKALGVDKNGKAN